MSNNKIPCQECKALGETKLFSKITNWHLVNAHKNLYPDVKTALKKYKQKFPEAPIVSDNFRSGPRKKTAVAKEPEKNITDLSEIDQAKWSRDQAHRKYLELEEKLKETTNVEDYQKIASVQQRYWKEASPPRSAIEGKKETRTITKKEQAEIDKNIKFLQSLEDKLDSVTGVDPNVAKFFKPV